MSIPISSANFPNVTNPKKGLMPNKKKKKGVKGMHKMPSGMMMSDNEMKKKMKSKSHYDRRMG